MLIVALVLAVIGLAALVTAVVTSNEVIAWVCIAASVIGVILLIIDALRERSRAADDESVTPAEPVEDYPDDATTQIPAHDDADDTSVVPASGEATGDAVDETAKRD